MYDIIIVNGKKESFIKIKENKLEGFNILNGVLSNLTEEELQTINSIKLSDNKTYLGKENKYDVYMDNNSELKHFFYKGIESIEMFCKYNTTDAILYDKQNLIKKVRNTKLEKAVIINRGKKILLISYWTILLLLSPITIKGWKIIFATHIVNVDAITYERIVDLLEEDNEISTSEKELLNNEKLLNDIIPYYNGTNMDYIATTCFKDLHFKYYNKHKNCNGYYTRLNSNQLNIKSNLESDEDIGTKCHEYIHLLQCNNGKYKYIFEACAELISYEYFDDFSIDAYKNAVKNTKILIEIVGPEAIWKLNFAGDDSELVAIIEQNLDSEKAKRLIKLLKTEPDKIENMDKEIGKLLGELYYNIHHTNMNENIYISHILDDTLISRYYFNSDKILENNPCYLEGIDVYDIKKELSYEEYLEALNKTGGINIKKVWLDESLNGTISIEEAMQLGKLKIYYEDKVYGFTAEELRADGYSIQFHGTLNVPEEIIEEFEKNPNDMEYRESISSFYEIRTLPNIYETFPNDNIEKNILE